MAWRRASCASRVHFAGFAPTPTAGRDLAGFTDGEDPSPPPTPAERAIDRDIILRGQKYCAAHGITSVHNMDGNFYQLELLEAIDAEGQAHLRCQMPFHFKNTFPIQRLSEAVEMRRRFRSERVSSGRMKLFMDGVLESWTALTLEDYPDLPGCRGAPNFSPEFFETIAVAADKLGLQMSVHAVGDGAVRRTLDGFQAARHANGARDSRHRIEHIETVHPDDLPRFRALGVIASMQPTHAPGPVFPLQPGLSRVRSEQLPLAYAWSRLRQAGATMMFNSDWPVAPLDPMISFKAALCRKPFAAGMPDQRQTLAELLEGYTRNSAYGEFMEQRKGRLRPGMLADVSVWSADLERTPPQELNCVKAIATICDGRLTHRA